MEEGDAEKATLSDLCGQARKSFQVLKTKTDKATADWHALTIGPDDDLKQLLKTIDEANLQICQ